MSSIIPVSTGFGESNGDPSGITSGNTTKDTSIVTIINKYSKPSETTNKHTYHMPKELFSVNPSNMLMEYPRGYPIGTPRNMFNKNPSSNPIAHPISDPDVLKQVIQESQVSK